MIGPSNPIASIGPMLAVPGMREALADADAPVVAVSPLVGGRSLKGPTEAFMALGRPPVDDGGVAACYAGIAAGMVVDRGTPTGPAIDDGHRAAPDRHADAGRRGARAARARGARLRAGTRRIGSRGHADRSDPARQELREREAAPRRQVRRLAAGGAGRGDGRGRARALWRGQRWGRWSWSRGAASARARRRARRREGHRRARGGPVRGRARGPGASRRARLRARRAGARRLPADGRR